MNSWSIPFLMAFLIYQLAPWTPIIVALIVAVAPGLLSAYFTHRGKVAAEKSRAASEKAELQATAAELAARESVKIGDQNAEKLVAIKTNVDGRLTLMEKRDQDQIEVIQKLQQTIQDLVVQIAESKAFDKGKASAISHELDTLKGRASALAE